MWGLQTTASTFGEASARLDDTMPSLHSRRAENIAAPGHTLFAQLVLDLVGLRTPYAVQFAPYLITDGVSTSTGAAGAGQKSKHGMKVGI